MEKSTPEKDTKSELQKTIEYLGVLREEYQSEIRIAVLVSIFVIFYVLVRELMTLVLAGYLISLLLDPILVRMQRIGIGRGKGIIFIFSLFFIAILLALSMLVPRLIKESVELFKAVPYYAEGSFLKTKELLREYFNLEIPTTGAEVKALVTSITEGGSLKNFETFVDPIGKTLFAGYNFTLTFINLFLLPFIVFYIAKDWNILNAQLSRAIPSAYKDTLLPFIKDVQAVIIGFAKGQSIVSFLLIIAYSLGLYLIDVRFALPLGVFAGILSVIPYLGFFVGFTLSLIIHIVHDGTLIGIIKLITVFIVIQTIEGNFVTPKVVSKSTGLHPLIVILSLIVGGTLFGFVGLILSIPAAAIIKLIMQRTLKPL